MFKFLDEFKKFAIKGNVIDMAIGIMIGTAFNGIVSSLVNDMIMPPIGYVTGGIKFDSFKFILKPEVTDNAGKVLAGAVSVNYGNFIQVLFNFVLVALSMFVAVKILNTLKEMQERKDKKAGHGGQPGIQQTEETGPMLTMETKEVHLLTEIRDLLEKRK